MDGIVAYAPFFSSDEAVIAEATGNMPKFGKPLCGLILPMQRILFGRNCNPTAVAGLSCANAPALVLQGSKDVEVSPDGCALYARRSELTDFPVTFQLVQEDESSGHMTVVRKKAVRRSMKIPSVWSMLFLTRYCVNKTCSNNPIVSRY